MEAADVPGGLAVMPPGPELAAALGAIDEGRVANDRILEVLRAQYRQLCHEQARMIAVIAEVGRCEGHPEPGVVRRLAVPEQYAAEETRAALVWTRRSADAEHALAETVVHGMPAVFAAWRAGDLDRQRVLVFDCYLTGLGPEQMAAVCRVAVPRAPKLTTAQLAALLRRMVIAVDPEAAARWYRKGIRERNVTAYPDPDGTITLAANGLPADEAEAACQRLQDLAAAAKRAGHPGLIGQIRCDLFLGLLDGRFHHMTRDQVIAALINDYRSTGPASGPPPDTAAPAEEPADPTDGDRADDDPAGRNSTDRDPQPGDPRDSRSGAARRPGHPNGEPAGPGDRADGGASESHDPAVPGPAPAADADRVARRPAGDERVGIEIRVGLATLLGRDEHPAEIPGLGLLPAPDARYRVSVQRRAEWRFAVTDRDGQLLVDGRTRCRPGRVGRHPIHRDGPPGGVVEIHVPLALLSALASNSPAADREWAELIADVHDRYRRREDHLADLDSRPDHRFPTAALRRHTEIRDRTCTFLGCRRRAHDTEQDHTRDHGRGGRTVRANLGPACPHDHDVKHEGGWQVEQPEPGTFVWRSPLGGEYTTQGEFLLPPMPDPSPIELPPDFDDLPMIVEGPILNRPPPRPPPPPPRPPPPAADPDEEPPF